VSSAAASQGDSGRAGVSGTAVAAGVAAAAAGAAAVAAAVKSSGGTEEKPSQDVVGSVPPVETVEVETTAVVAEPPPVETVEVVETVQPVDPGRDDSVLAELPDTTTGKEHLRENEEGRPGSGV
jgi:hypothetical protein